VSDITIHSRIWWEKKEVDLSVIPDILRNIIMETGIYKKGPDYLTILLIWSYLNKENDECDYAIIKDRILTDMTRIYGDNLIYQFNIENKDNIVEIDSKDKLIWLLYNIINEDTQNFVIEGYWSGMETYWLKNDEFKDLGSTFWKGSDLQTEEGLVFTILLRLHNEEKPLYLNLTCTITPQKEYKVKNDGVFLFVEYNSKHYLSLIGKSSKLEGFVRYTLDEKEEILTILSKKPFVL
jgi:hypothetical protein